MSNRADVFALLSRRAGQWVSRDDLNFVGGQDTSRRMRELEEDVGNSGQWRLESRRDGKKRYEYRLMPIVPEPPAVKGIWRCTNCGARPVGPTMVAIDPRWRIGRCACGKDRIFKESPA